MIKKTVAHSGCFAIWRYLNLKPTSLKFFNFLTLTTKNALQGVK